MNKLTLHQTRKTVLSFIILLLFTSTFSNSVDAAQITLAWDKPEDSRVTGYNIYYGISGTDFTFSPAQTIRSVDQTSAIIADLQEGQSYSFAATTVDGNGNESAFSETIQYKVISPNDIDDDNDGYTENQGDCDDVNGAVHPGAIDICGDGIDQNCDGIDPLCPEDIDNDNDGYTENQGDCDDADGAVHPGAIDICGDGIDQDCDGTDLECTPTAPFVLETGEIQIDHQWTFVEMKKTFVNPIVVANPLGSNGASPAVVRVRNVTAGGFDICVQEWDYLDGIHAVETIGYIVMEAGSHRLPDGTMVEAGRFDTNAEASIAFSKIFAQKPVVVAGVTSFNDNDAVTGRIYRVIESGFDFSLQEQELNNDGHSLETISYIAWEPSSGEIDGKLYEVAVTPETFTHAFGYVPFNQPFSEAPVCVADMQTINGADTANVRWQNKDAYGIEFKIDEETSLDATISHYRAEAIGYILIDSTPAFTLETGDIQINHEWVFVSLTQRFNDPVVVAKPASYNGGEPAVVRIRNVSNQGFEIRLQEWEYLDGRHDPEIVSYIVMEAGVHILPDGTVVEAGAFDTNGPQSIMLPLSGTFAEAPVVLAGVISENEPSAVTGRVYNVNNTGFNFQLQEQESSSQTHATETIAYIAWEPSSGEVDGRRYEVIKTPKAVKSNFYAITFISSFTRAPILVADMQTMNETDTANLRWRNKDAYGVEVKISEETSFDKEAKHSAEVAGYLAIE